MRRMSKAADRLAEGDLGPVLRGDRFGAYANQGKDTHGECFSGPATEFVGCFHRIDRSDSFFRDRAVIQLKLRGLRVANRPHTCYLARGVCYTANKIVRSTGYLTIRVHVPLLSSS